MGSRHKKLKCFGRSVIVSFGAIPKNNEHRSYVQSGHRLKVKNINGSIGLKQFEEWVFGVTNTKQRKHLISDIFLCRNREQTSSECIMAFHSLNDAQIVVQKMNNLKFRGKKLPFKHWIHPKKRLKHKINKKVQNIQSEASSTSNPWNPRKRSLSSSNIIKSEISKKSNERQTKSEEIKNGNYNKQKLIEQIKSMKFKMQSISHETNNILAPALKQLNESQNATKQIKQKLIMQRMTDNHREHKMLKQKISQITKQFDSVDQAKKFKKQKELNQILDTLTPQTYHNVLEEIMDIIYETATKRQIKEIMALVLRFVINSEQRKQNEFDELMRKYLDLQNKYNQLEQLQDEELEQEQDDDEQLFSSPNFDNLSLDSLYFGSTSIEHCTENDAVFN